MDANLKCTKMWNDYIMDNEKLELLKNNVI